MHLSLMRQGCAGTVTTMQQHDDDKQRQNGSDLSESLHPGRRTGTVLSFDEVFSDKWSQPKGFVHGQHSDDEQHAEAAYGMDQHVGLTIPDATQRYTHLQFRRFAGCPIFNFHLHTFFKSNQRIEAAGIREVIFFHSSESEMQKHQSEYAATVVADPGKKFYAKFGVSRSLFAILHPKALWAAVKGMILGKLGLKMENGPLGLPADILLDRSGTVVAVKYGTHADDQWEVEQLLQLVVGFGSAALA